VVQRVSGKFCQIICKTLPACSILLVPPQLLTQCLRVQDNDTYQAKFNSLIELNQANRGDLLRSPTKEKLVVFLEKLRDDPTGE
jgi:hypothetical protein